MVGFIKAIVWENIKNDKRKIYHTHSRDDQKNRSHYARKNILYGNSEEINDSEIIDLLKEFNLFNESTGYDLDRIIDNKSLSSGQMQKIGFIRALLIRPEILLLDESMANLDDASKNLIMSIISEQNITLINSTHDPEFHKNVDSIIEIKIVDEKRVLKVTK